MMNYKYPVLLLFSLLTGIQVIAQKPFTEGIIVYKVTMMTADNKEYKGVYTFTFKGTQIKKELKLGNGYQDVVIYNCGASTLYSLQNRGGKKYAIQLSMEHYIQEQEKFAGFHLKTETTDNKKIAGFTANKGAISYNDGTVAEISYTNEWYPSQPIAFERFPDARFFPLYFSYTDEKGMTMQFEATKIEAEPIENSVFRIPPDYKIISYGEYKELSK